MIFWHGTWKIHSGALCDPHIVMYVLQTWSKTVELVYILFNKANSGPSPLRVPQWGNLVGPGPVGKDQINGFQKAIYCTVITGSNSVIVQLWTFCIHHLQVDGPQIKAHQVWWSLTQNLLLAPDLHRRRRKCHSKALSSLFWTDLTDLYEYDWSCKSKYDKSALLVHIKLQVFM